MVNQERLAYTIRTIMHQHHLSQQQFGESIGVSPVAIHYVLAGKRNLRLERIEKMCEVWGVDINFLVDGREKTDESKAAILTEIMRIKNVEIPDLVKKSGLDILTITGIKRGLRKPSDDEWQKIVSALNPNGNVVDEGVITSAMANIKMEMERMYIHEESIQAIITYLEKEIQNRRRFK